MIGAHPTIWYEQASCALSPTSRAAGSDLDLQSLEGQVQHGLTSTSRCRALRRRCPR